MLLQKLNIVQEFLLVASQGNSQGRQVSGGGDGGVTSCLNISGSQPPPMYPTYSRLSWATSLKLQRPNLEKLSW